MTKLDLIADNPIISIRLIIIANQIDIDGTAVTILPFGATLVLL